MDKMQLEPKLEKVWKVIYSKFKDAEIDPDLFTIKRRFYHGFIFSFNHRNYELASAGQHGENAFKIRTYAIEVVGNVEVSLPDISKRKELKELEFTVSEDGFITDAEDTIVPVSHFVDFYMTGIRNCHPLD